MPQVLPAVASFAAAAFSSAVAFVGAGLTAVGFSATASATIASQIITTAAMTAASAGIAVLMRPDTPSSGMTLDFKPDPKAPVTGLMGYTATGGNKVFQSTWGYNNVAQSIGVALSLGPIQEITKFKAGDAIVTFGGSQNEATGFYDGDMWQTTTKGLPTDTAIMPPTGLKYGTPALSGWGANNAAKGVAFAFWTMVLAKNPEDRNIFTQGVPTPEWTGRWMKIYDWRRDSTYPGGVGNQRENDWRTWEFTENPILHARAFLRGHHKLNDDGSVDFSKRIAGVGAPVSAIDMPAFNEAANVADMNNWKISGSWSSSDAKWDVLASMLKAGSAIPMQNGARISVMVNTPRVSVGVIDRDDVVGEISISPLVRRRERKNTIIPRYRSEQHSWEFVPAGEVTSSVYRTEDRGEMRSLEVQYTYVRDAKQAAQLAAFDLANLRESIFVTATLKADAMSFAVGDCVTLNIPDVGLANQKAIILRKTTDYQSATVTIECRSETDGKYAWALGQAANPPPTPSLSGVDPNYIPPPLPVDWSVAPKPPHSGTSQPVIIVIGQIDRGDIAEVIVEYATAATGPWASAGSADPSTGEYVITGLSPEQQYWVSIRYVSNNGTISGRYITGPHTAPRLIADGLSPDSPTLTALEDQLDELFDTTALLEGDLAAGLEVIEDTQAEVTAARQGSPNLSANILGIKTTVSDEALIRATEINRVEADAAKLTLLTSITPKPAEETLKFYTRTSGGRPEEVLDFPADRHGTDEFGGDYFSLPGAAGAQYILPKAVVYYKPGLKIKMTAKVRSIGAAGQIQFRLSGLASDYTTTSASSNSVVAIPADETVTISSIVWSVDTLVNKTFIRGRVGALTSDVRVYDMTVEDVTDVSDLSASVTTNTIAIANVETKQALASYEVVAAASGGKPARLKLISSSLGSAVALDAPWIYFGDNTVFDDATDTLQTTIGLNKRVMAFGAPFGTSNTLLEWWGPATTSLAFMSSSNGYNGRMTVAPYVFDNSGGQVFSLKSTHSTIVGNRTGAGSVTTPLVTFEAVGATGPVTFDVYFFAGDGTITITNPSSTDNTSPFQHQTAFSGSVTASQIKTGRYICAARDSAGNSATAAVVATLIGNI